MLWQMAMGYGAPQQQQQFGMPPMASPSYGNPVGVGQIPYNPSNALPSIPTPYMGQQQQQGGGYQQNAYPNSYPQAPSSNFQPVQSGNSYGSPVINQGGGYSNGGGTSGAPIMSPLPVLGPQSNNSVPIEEVSEIELPDIAAVDELLYENELKQQNETISDNLMQEFAKNQPQVNFSSYYSNKYSDITSNYQPVQQQHPFPRMEEVVVNAAPIIPINDSFEYVANNNSYKQKQVAPAVNKNGYKTQECCAKSATNSKAISCLYFG